jgi:hypothetical protein
MAKKAVISTFPKLCKIVLIKEALGSPAVTEDNITDAIVPIVMAAPCIPKTSPIPKII